MNFLPNSPRLTAKPPLGAKWKSTPQWLALNRA
jgi:hypothetical protein